MVIVVGKRYLHPVTTRGLDTNGFPTSNRLVEILFWLIDFLFPLPTLARKQNEIN